MPKQRSYRKKRSPPPTPKAKATRSRKKNNVYRKPRYNKQNTDKIVKTRVQAMREAIAFHAMTSTEKAHFLLVNHSVNLRYATRDEFVAAAQNLNIKL